MRIGLISDTHNYFDDKLKLFLNEVDEIWHAGDIGSLSIADEISDFKPLKAVYGNIDGSDIRAIYPLEQNFLCEKLKVYISHITGYPGRYSKNIQQKININKPDILVGGHSHILKVIFDKSNNLLFINPGAAGIYGFHTVRTALRFTVKDKISDLEIWESKKNNAI